MHSMTYEVSSSPMCTLRSIEAPPNSSFMLIELMGLEQYILTMPLDGPYASKDLCGQQNEKKLLVFKYRNCNLKSSHLYLLVSICTSP